MIAGLSAEATYHAPTNVMRQRRAAEVLVLPSGGSAQALVLPAKEQVGEVGLTR